jgi:hypothetical protein
VLLDQPAQELVIEGVGERPMLSINRGFSAPIVVESDRGPEPISPSSPPMTTIRSPATRRCSN